MTGGTGGHHQLRSGTVLNEAREWGPLPDVEIFFRQIKNSKQLACPVVGFGFFFPRLSNCCTIKFLV